MCLSYAERVEYKKSVILLEYYGKQYLVSPMTGVLFLALPEHLAGELRFGLLELE